MKKPDPENLTEVQRENLVNALVDDWLSTLRSDATSMDFYIREWLTEGRIGYFMHDDEELVDLAEGVGIFDEETEDEKA